MSFLGNFFGNTSQTSLSDAKTVLDMVTNTAGLASNPQDIDPILDDVRSVTSNLSPGEPPSAADNQRLIGVYLRLEEYLITSEPLRPFTKGELRKRLSDGLRKQVETYEAKG